MTSQFLTPSLLAWHSFPDSNKPRSNPLSVMKEALNTSYHLKEQTLDSSALASTGDIYNIDNICLAGIIGKPFWKHHDLEEISNSKGPAAALATAYSTHGDKFTNLIGGDYSFVILDNSKMLCIAGVDRLARYPLYYSKTDSGVGVSSTASTLLEQPKASKILDEQGIYNYVYFHMVPSPSSVYKNISKLPAGHLIRLTKQNTEVIHYWKPVFKTSNSTSFGALGKQLKVALQNAVKKNLDSNQCTGAFLSGGLDSSTVVGMLSEVSEREATAFSIGFAAEGYDEMEYARITAKHFGVKLHEYYVTPEDVVEALPKIATSYDEPFGNSSALPAYFCAKLAKENGIDRLLAGDGGDELFAGNERYAKQAIFELYHKTPNWLRSAIIEPSILSLPDTPGILGKSKRYIQQANTRLPDRLQSYNFLHQHDPQEIFTEGLLKEVDTTLPLVYLRATFNEPCDASVLNRMLYLDWQYTLADNDLRKVSHMCAMAGIEVVYPMLDDELIDLSCRVPDRWKLNGHKLRFFFKESLHGWLPNETLAKKKQGFGLPFGVWMRTHKPLQELAFDSLMKLKNRGIFNSDYLTKVIDLHKHGHASYYGELIWILMVLELWLEEHASRPSIPPPDTHREK